MPITPSPCDRKETKQRLKTRIFRILLVGDENCLIATFARFVSEDTLESSAILIIVKIIASVSDLCDCVFNYEHRSNECDKIYTRITQ